MEPGCLLISKTNFVCSGYQCEWKREKEKPCGERKTLREILISKGEVVILLSPVEKYQDFKKYGIENETQVATFLNKRSICFVSTNEGINQYFSPLTSKEVYDKYRNF